MTTLRLPPDSKGQRVDRRSRNRAARALDGDVLAGERLHRIGQPRLHRALTLLDLPTREWRAVVLYRELVAGHLATTPAGGS